MEKSTRNWRASLLQSLGTFCLARRRAVYFSWALALVASIGSVLWFGLGIDTSRQKMVSEENPHSARYQAFLEDFGTPLHLVVVVEGENPRANKAFAQGLTEDLATAPDLIRGVTCRASLENFRPFFLLFSDTSSLQKINERLEWFLDPDEDGIPWRKDNCPYVANPNQADGDSDGSGDACAMDWDNDGVANDSDPCPRAPQELGEKPRCPTETKRMGLLALFEALNQGLSWLEEGDVSSLASFEKPLQKLNKDRDSSASSFRFESLMRELRSILLEDHWTELGYLSGEEGEETLLSSAGIDEEGFFVADEGKLVFVFVQPRSDSDAGEAVIPFVRHVEERIGALLPPGVKAAATGNPAFVAEEMVLLSRDVIVTAAVASVGILLLFLFAYRSIYAAAVVFLPLVAGMVACLGITAFFYGNLNLISSSLFAIIVGLGIDFGIHLLARFLEVHDSVGTREEAAHEMMRKAGPGVLTGGCTTVAAFLALNISDFHGMQQLGTLSAIGLVLILMAYFTLLPCLVVDVTGLKPTKKVSGGEGRRFDKLFSITTRHPVVTLVMVALVSVGMALSIGTFRFSFNVQEFLPKDTSTRLAYNRLMETEAFSPDFAVMVTGSVAEAREKTEALLEREDLVSRVQSAATFLPDTSPSKEKQLAVLRANLQALGAHYPELGVRRPGVRASEASRSLLFMTPPQLIEELEEMVEHFEMDVPFFLSQNKRKLEGMGMTVPDAKKMTAQWKELLKDVKSEDAAKVAARLKNVETRFVEMAEGLVALGESEDRTMTVRELPGDLQRSLWRRRDDGTDRFAMQIYPTGEVSDPVFMDKFLEHTQEIDPDITGFPVTFLAFGNLLTDGLTRAAMLSLCVILFLLFFDYRKFLPIFLTLFPLAIGTLWMVGAMHLLDMSFNFASMMGIPLILGIGVDSGIHLVHRYLQGTSPALLAETTGKAVFLSSMTTMVGMGSMVIGVHGGVHSLGQVLLIGVTSCLISATFVLPALMQLIVRRRQA